MGLVVFDIDKNFWEINPVLKIPKAFRDLYDKDKTKNKEESSRLMWALALAYDYDSKYAAMRELERLQKVTIDFLNKKEYSFDSKLINEYNLMQNDADRRMLVVLDKRIDRMLDILDNDHINLDELETDTKIMKNLLDLQEKKEKFKKRLDKQITTEKNRANTKESFLEEQDD